MSERDALWLAIDGGGTRCRLRLYDPQGQIIAEADSGSANLQLGIDVTYGAIHTALRKLLSAAGMSDEDLGRMRVGGGLAGVVSPADRQRVQQYPHPFRDLVVESDAYTACLGAHSGKEGAVMILGTGSCVVVNQAGEYRVLGGWGFPVSDQGSGAVLGLRLLERALLAHDGVVEQSPLLYAVMQDFKHQPAQLVEWHIKARPADYAAYAPRVFAYAAQGDLAAEELLRRQAGDIDGYLQRLQSMGVTRVALLGGLAEAIRPWLDAQLSLMLVDAESDALTGAWLLARQRLSGE